MKKEQLENEIREASWYYYNDPNRGSMSDEIYDELIRMLKKDYPDSVVLKEVGAPPKSDLIRHLRKMYSLDNSLNEEEFNNFIRRVGIKTQLVASLKLDGASCELIYLNGILISASTRGDGLYGEDCTEIVSKIVPNTIESSSMTQVTGEITIPLEAFKRFEQEFSSPRNLAAGSMMTKDDPNILLDRGAVFTTYGFYNNQESNYSDELLTLGNLGFKTVPWIMVDMNPELAFDFFEKTVRDEVKNEIGLSDGVVFRVDKYNLSNNLGYSEKAPKFAIAYKFEAKEFETEIINIRWDISRNGTLTPVAEISPVVIEGAEITNVTLHNARMILENEISIGSKITIIRSGGVIPKFIRRVSEAVKYELPYQCPYCNEVLVFDSVRLKCCNSKCSPQLVEAIVDFLWKLDHKGLAGKSIERLVYYAEVNSIAGLFRLKGEDIASYLGYNDYHAEEVYDGLQNLKKVPFDKFLQALGIDMLGKTYARAISNAITSERFFKIMDHPSELEEALSSILGCGEILTRITKSIYTIAPVIQDLISAGFKVIDKGQYNTNKNKLNFVITGTLSKPRKEFQKMIEDQGHNYQDSLNKETNYLVAGEDIGANKIAKAQKYGTKIINEVKLMEILWG